MIVYWAYALLAVPWIEPSFNGRLSVGNITEADRVKREKNRPTPKWIGCEDISRPADWRPSA